MDTIIDSTRFEVALSNRESTELAGNMWSGFGFSAVVLSLLTAYPLAAMIENAKPVVLVDEGVRRPRALPSTMMGSAIPRALPRCLGIRQGVVTIGQCTVL